MSTPLDKNLIDKQIESLPLWKQQAYQHFSSMIANDGNTFPCIPARIGFQSNNLRFSFIGDPRKFHSTVELAETLREYGKCSRNTGKYASLVVFFETPKEMLEDYNIEDYRELFWTVLNNVTALDKNEWPKDIPTDSAHHKWEFCFNREPYFVFCATPAHLVRRSRNFPCLLMAFQPRWVFEQINDSTSFGRTMKKLIRQQLANYDNVPAHPDLKWYGNEDNHEWKQYYLSDDEESPIKCPFMRMKNTFSKFLK